MNIDRRDALAGIAAMFGAGLYAPIARALASDTTPISAGPPSVAVFTPQQRALVTALSERVMPTTDTPGDIAAGVLLIREAGGVVTDLSGRAVGIEHTGLVAGNPAIHGWLLRTLGAAEGSPHR